MRAYEIEGWLKKKIRRKCWYKDRFVFFDNMNWFDADDQLKTNSLDLFNYLFRSDDWEPYIEPKRKKTVTMYRAIRDETKFYGCYLIESPWSSEKSFFETGDHRGKIVGWQEMTVEVEE